MDEDGDRHRNNIAGLIAVAIVVILGVLLMQALLSNLKKERCAEEHRRYCDTVPPP